MYNRLYTDRLASSIFREVFVPKTQISCILLRFSLRLQISFTWCKKLQNSGFVAMVEVFKGSLSATPEMLPVAQFLPPEMLNPHI